MSWARRASSSFVSSWCRPMSSRYRRTRSSLSRSVRLRTRATVPSRRGRSSVARGERATVDSRTTRDASLFLDFFRDFFRKKWSASADGSGEQCRGVGPSIVHPFGYPPHIHPDPGPQAAHRLPPEPFRSFRRPACNFFGERAMMRPLHRQGAMADTVWGDT
jgi:hypothetical protein